MKRQSTTPVSPPLATRASLVAISAVVLGAGIFQLSPHVFARDYEAEIRNLEQQEAAARREADRLGAMAATLEEELGRINGQISAIQAQIEAKQKELDKLAADIKKSKEAIQKNRRAMGQILSDMYVDDQISPLEMLASSESIGDFIDKQEQRSSLRSSLNDKIKEIKQLQAKLEEDKKKVERALADQKSQRAQLAVKEAEQQKLVSDTKNDQNNYAALAAERNSRAAQVRAEQAAANRRATGVNIPAGTPGGGGYPGVWANAPLDAYVDPWGLYTRECVSYVAWKIHSTGRYVPHFNGAGNANQWPTTAAAHGIRSGSTPKVGSAAVMYVGVYGHVMYVESVNGDGTITVSDYNLAWDGLYRKYTRSAAGLTYVYF
ncbi:MAG: CHAP domain-containing protein [Candidatus Saccharibacteria bacterium]|nr:CHAP domain-containing protein [Candidatus Saccharibacteria bacterium]